MTCTALRTSPVASHCNKPAVRGLLKRSSQTSIQSYTRALTRRQRCSAAGEFEGDTAAAAAVVASVYASDTSKRRLPSWSLRHRTLRPPSREASTCNATVTAIPSTSCNTAPSFAPSLPRTSASPESGVELGWRRDVSKHYLVKPKLLGQGSFGVVHEGVDLRSGTPVAVKVLPKISASLLREGNIRKLQREISVMKSLQGCPGVVRLQDYFEDALSVQIVMEICHGADLQKMVQAHGTLCERSLSLVAREKLRVLQECHVQGVLHCDVKPANFCLKDPGVHPLYGQGTQHASTPWLKALDFGTSQQLPAAGQRLTKRAGTPAFIAPEVYNRDYSVASDVWSFGVSLYWMFTHRFPFFHESCRVCRLDEVMEAVAKAPISFEGDAWARMSPEGIDFIQRCLQRDERKRLTVEEASSHPWLQEAIALAGPLA